MIYHAILAASELPRGPGLYLNLFTFFLVFCSYLIWIRCCWWVDSDTRKVNFDPDLWNSMLFAGGLVGLIFFWLVPPFAVAFPLMVGLYLVPFVVYVQKRNAEVPKEERVFTAHHFEKLMQKWFKMKVELEKEEKPPGPNVRFLSRGKDATTENSPHLLKLIKSKAYMAAMELVYDAIARRSSDIHLEPKKDQVTVRYRIDGILQPDEPFDRATGDAVVNVFKVLGAMDISEKRKPQDGGFGAKVDGRQIDFRAATQGTTEGEKLSLRVLDPSKTLMQLTDLGMRDKMVQQVRALAAEPHGMIIAAGPTGAGKSTSLYAILREMDRYTRNVITIEDPIEYHLDDATQIQINPKAGQTFAASLRAVLRQDPDVIMIGEVRDQETAQIACQAATTGHMVFTTIHANDAIAVLFRMLSLGVEPMLVAGAVSAVWSQRLVRILCPKCKIKYKPNAEMVRKANLPADKITHFCRAPKETERPKNAKGKPVACENCLGMGYRGRVGVFELLTINEKIRELVRSNQPLSAVKQEAIKNGMTNLQDEAMRLVMKGTTSIEEVLRVLK